MKQKKEDYHSLPDLPPLKMPFSARVKESQPELPELPSFPDSPLNKGFTQSAIKEAVESSEDKEKLPSLPEAPKQETKKIEMKEWSPQIPPPEREQIQSIPLPQLRPKNEDIFIKLDKFHTAKKTLELTRNKIEEIDALLKRIRETKMREDQELSSWESEIAEIKAKINEVTLNIFEKA